MESGVRKPFQGVWNIIRFNWHYYALSVSVIIFLLIVHQYSGQFGGASIYIAIFIVCLTIISLAVSFYIYDVSGLYKLLWLNDLQFGRKETIININAGFDETSSLLKSRFSDCELLVADFYDPAKHTEVSIKRARKAYPPFPQTQQISTSHLPFESGTADKIFAILSAHEIRNDQERIVFFKELHRVINRTGRIVVTEHLRDSANFLAYNIGTFHFYSRSAWLKTFEAAGLCVSEEIKVTPFITSFILEKNGTAS
jgi:ubiquinone/menaquinone biosynthesis C-methylase UbiE